MTTNLTRPAQTVDVEDGTWKQMQHMQLGSGSAWNMAVDVEQGHGGGLLFVRALCMLGAVGLRSVCAQCWCELCVHLVLCARSLLFVRALCTVVHTLYPFDAAGSRSVCV